VVIGLYQFTFSHYCEKARWALDYKGARYRTINLLPGLHMRVAKKLTPDPSLPIVVLDDGTVVQDSTAIISFLDEEYAVRPLTPRDSEQAKKALEWEAYLDEEIGVTLRLWFYYHLLPDRERALRFMLDGAPWYGRPLFTFVFPRVRSAMMDFMNINADSAKRSQERLLTALDRLDNALKDRRHLVGDRFTRADLTACALLSPYCIPGDQEASAMFPEQLQEQRDKHKSSPFFGWVRDMYKDHRQPLSHA
jgi:glutathione S-transferase